MSQPSKFQCQGLIKNRKRRCKNKGTLNGYCHIHHSSWKKNQDELTTLYFDSFLSGDTILSTLLLHLAPMYVGNLRYVNKKLLAFSSGPHLRKLYNEKWKGLYKQMFAEVPLDREPGSKVFARPTKTKAIITFLERSPDHVHMWVKINDMTVSIGLHEFSLSMHFYAVGNRGDFAVYPREHEVPDEDKYAPITHTSGSLSLSNILTEFGWRDLSYETLRDHIVWCLKLHDIEVTLVS